MWKQLGVNPEKEAKEAQLLPGDGIARKVFVLRSPPTLGAANEAVPEPIADTREQRLELVSIEPYGFIGREPDGLMHACRWGEAVAYEKRTEC